MDGVFYRCVLSVQLDHFLFILDTRAVIFKMDAEKLILLVSVKRKPLTREKLYCSDNPPSTSSNTISLLRLGYYSQLVAMVLSKGLI